MLSLWGTCKTRIEAEAGSQAMWLIYILIHLTHSVGLVCFLPLNLELLQKIQFGQFGLSIKMMTVRLFPLKERLCPLSTAKQTT